MNETSCGVYLIQYDEADYTKIGWTQYVQNRLTVLQQSYSAPLAVRYFLECEYDVQAVAHEAECQTICEHWLADIFFRYVGQRTRDGWAEWYHAHPDVIARRCADFGEQFVPCEIRARPAAAPRGLSDSQKHDILGAFYSGETKSAIAKRMGLTYNQVRHVCLNPICYEGRVFDPWRITLSVIERD